MSNKIMLDKQKVLALVGSEKALKEEVKKYRTMAADFQKEVEVWKMSAGAFQKEVGHYAEEARTKGFTLAQALIDISRLKNEVDFQQSYREQTERRRQNLITEVEEKRKTIQQLRDQLGLGYKMGLGAIPLGEEERNRWRARVREQSSHIGAMQTRITRMREDVNNIEFLKARIRRIEGGAPVGARPFTRGTGWICPDCKGVNGLNRFICYCGAKQPVVDTETNPNPGGEIHKPYSSRPQFEGTLGSYLVQAQAAERAAEQEARMKKAIADEVAKQIEAQQVKMVPENEIWKAPTMRFHKSCLDNLAHNEWAKKFIKEVDETGKMMSKLPKGPAVKKPLTKKKLK